MNVIHSFCHNPIPIIVTVLSSKILFIFFIVFIGVDAIHQKDFISMNKSTHGNSIRLHWYRATEVGYNPNRRENIHVSRSFRSMSRTFAGTKVDRYIVHSLYRKGSFCSLYSHDLFPTRLEGKFGTCCVHSFLFPSCDSKFLLFICWWMLPQHRRKQTIGATVSRREVGACPWQPLFRFQCFVLTNRFLRSIACGRQ